jgi:hypothetical protein
MIDQYEREEAQLEQELSCGDISEREYNNQMRHMQQSYWEEAKGAAQCAYDDEMFNW